MRAIWSGSRTNRWSWPPAPMASRNPRRFAFWLMTCWFLFFFEAPLATEWKVAACNRWLTRPSPTAASHHDLEGRDVASIVTFTKVVFISWCDDRLVTSSLIIVKPHGWTVLVGLFHLIFFDFVTPEHVFCDKWSSWKTLLFLQEDDGIGSVGNFGQPEAKQYRHYGD